MNHLNAETVPETDHEKIVRARCLLLTKAPWYGHASTAMSWLRDDSIETMAVCIGSTGKIECRFCQKFVDDLTTYEVAMVIQHEVEHVIRRHCWRGHDFQPLIANIACDMVVNGYQNAPFIGIPNPTTGQPVIPTPERLVWLPVDWEPTLTMEQVYERLLHTPSLLGDYCKYRGTLDSHAPWTENETDETAVLAAARSLAEAASQSSVDVPPRLSKFVAELRHGEIGWRMLLRQFMQTVSSKRTIDWNRRNRRIDCFGIPGRVRRGKKELAVVVDVSSSITESQLSMFFGAIETLLAYAEFSVLGWTTRKVYFNEKYLRGDWKKLIRFSGGGTDMVAPVKWLIKNKCQRSGIIMLTDGYCNWPKPMPTPLLVICASSQESVKIPSWIRHTHIS